jgi:SMC interacting uncharacterized protein involved in chromosome segregation
VHWVTKVFIVGAAVLSVLLAALVMAYSVNVKEIRDEHANLVAAKLAAETTSQNQATAFAGERTKFTETINAKETEAAQLRQANAQLQTENAAARTDKVRADSNVESITQKIAQLAETNKTLTSLIERYRDEVTALRDGELKYRKREIELVDRNNDLEAQKEVLDGQARALDEQVHELRAQVESLKTGGDSALDPNQPPRALNAFRGRITEVKRDSKSGDLLAEINLGTNDGVKDRMELWLARDATLLGRLTVIKSDLRSSIGRFDSLGIRDPNTRKPFELRPEDEVYSSVFH